MYKGFIKDVMNARDITSLNIVEPPGVYVRQHYAQKTGMFFLPNK